MLKTLSLTTGLLFAVMAVPVMADVTADAYVTSADTVDAKAGAFVTGITEHKTGTEGRKRELLTAIDGYLALMSEGDQTADPTVAEAAARSAESVSAWRVIIADMDENVLGMRPFWEQASDVFMDRLELEAALGVARTPLMAAPKVIPQK